MLCDVCVDVFVVCVVRCCLCVSVFVVVGLLFCFVVCAVALCVCWMFVVC